MASIIPLQESRAGRVACRQLLEVGWAFSMSGVVQ